MSLENPHINPFLQDRENANRERQEKAEKESGRFKSSMMGSLARKLTLGAVGLASALTGTAQASQKKVMSAEGDVAKYELLLAQANRGGDQKKINKAELELAEKRKKLATAKGEDADETEKRNNNTLDASKIGSAHGNKAVITGTEREQEVDLYDSNGKVVGHRKERDASKDMMKHEEKMQKNSRPTIVVDNSNIGGPTVFSNGAGNASYGNNPNNPEVLGGHGRNR